MIVLVESNYGKERVKKDLGLNSLSTKGSSVVVFNKNTSPSVSSYGVDSRLLNYLKTFANGKVIISTDADFVGTKTATVLKHKLENMGIKAVRMPVTDKGVAYCGSFFSEKQMKMAAQMDKLNITVAEFFKKKFGNKLPFAVGYTKAVVIGYLNGKGGERFKVKTGKTNTAVAYTKCMLGGKSATVASRSLSKLYVSGSIFYPRVDNDYHTEPYNVYAHPPLTAKGYEDEMISGFQTEELVLNKKTALMYLSNDRIITPSMMLFYYNVIDEIYDDNLKPKEEYKSVVKECESILKESQVDYHTEFLKNLHPVMPLKPVAFKKEKNRDKDEDIRKAEEELFERLLKAEKELEEERKRLINAVIERKKRKAKTKKNTTDLPNIMPNRTLPSVTEGIEDIGDIETNRDNDNIFPSL